MTDLLTFMALALVCLTLAQLNIVLFGIIGRAMRDKAILGDKEIIVVSLEDDTTDEDDEAAEETAEEVAEETEGAANEQQETDETDANAAEESGESTESKQLANLAVRVAALATEVSILAARTEAKQ